MDAFREFASTPAGDVNEQAAAWRVVIKQLIERKEWRDTEFASEQSGVEKAVFFLETHLPK